MSESILTSIKKMLGIAADYTDFDMDVTININSALSALQQLGVGPAEGFMIMDAGPTWDDLLFGDYRLNLVKNYIFLKTRIIFDPPNTSYWMDSMKEQIRELEFRIVVATEPATANEVIYDGGVP